MAGEDRAPGAVIDTVTIAGRSLEVRIAEAADGPALLALYRRLSPDDLRKRFFSGFQPDQGFIDSWIDRTRQGGIVLVVVEPSESDEASHERIVADAGYVPTASDVAELAITIDTDHRGWLGPYLLDLLVEQARYDGIANLEAEVLSSNCSMIALLRARGCAFIPSDDPSVARLMIGTAGSTPVWPADSPHPRVLVEGSTGSWAGARAAAKAGISVMVCPGPGRGRTHRCPLLADQQCPLVDEADAVVVALPVDEASTGELLQQHERDRSTQPLAVSTRLRTAYGEVAGRVGFEVDGGISAAEAIDALDDAINDAGATAQDERDSR
jgi:L-amino acid N-acyltransferase YncA